MLATLFWRLGRNLHWYLSEGVIRNHGQIGSWIWAQANREFISSIKPVSCICKRQPFHSYAEDTRTLALPYHCISERETKQVDKNVCTNVVFIIDVDIIH